MSTPEYPPAWQPPPGSAQPPYPPTSGGAAPLGNPPAAYPASAGYPQPGYPQPGYAQPGQPYPGQPYADQPYPGQAPPGQPYPGSAYPPTGTQPSGYPPSGYPPSGHPPSSAPPFPPTEPGAAGPDPAPPKKSIGGKIVGLVGSVLVVVLVAGLKFGGVAFLRNLLDSGPSNPFEGTAAANYPVGEAGIVVPAATAVPGFTEAQVAEALETVRQALIAGRLDERMLYDHDRSALRALFAPLGAEDLDLMFEEKLGGIVATMIAPGYTLTDDPIRVSGTMTFTGIELDEIRWLEVHTVFVWVYPFSGKLKTPGDHLVTIKDDLYWLFPSPEDVYPEGTGMYLDTRSSSYAHNIDCDLLDQDLVALGKPRIGVGGGVDTDDVMDPNSPVNLPDNC